VLSERSRQGAMRGAGFTAIVLAATVMAALPVVAHHSFSAEYDAKKPVKLTGTVTKMLWSNPHAWIHIEVKGKDGKAVQWACETGGANALYRRGWRKEDLVPGTVLVIDGFQARNSTPTMNATTITFMDGRKLFAGSSSQQGSSSGK
jgi:hypothetical protein